MLWNYIIDGLLILIILASMIIGIVKGLFDSILSLVGTGLALVIAIFTAKHLANFINKIFNFEDIILQKLDGGEGGAIEFFNGKFKFDNVEIAKFVVWIISLVIIFIVIKLAIFILSKIFESITKNSPALSGINRVLGMVFGMVKGGVIVIAMLAVCSLLSQVPTIGTPIYEKIANTKITSGVFKWVDEFIENNVTEDTVRDIVDRIISDNKPSDNAGGESGESASGQSGSSAISYKVDNNSLVIEV